MTGHSSATCDLMSAQSTLRALAGGDKGTTMVMCAAITPSVNNSLSTLTRNVVMVQNLLRALPPGGIRSLVYLSSVDVYGRQQHAGPINEDTPLTPQGPYALSKVVGEQMLRAAADLCGPTTVLRLPQIYGPMDRGKSVVGQFVRNTVAREEVQIHGKGASSRDLVAVADVANIVLHFVRRPTDDCVNIATGTSHTILELISIIGAALETTPRVRHVSAPVPETTLEFRVSKLKQLCSDVSLTSLASGVREYAAAAVRGKLDMA